LYAYGLPITDTGLKHLTGLAQLRTLDLSSTQVRGLRLLGPMTALEALDLHATVIGDADLEHLLVLPGLKSLWIQETQISDAAVPVLSKLQNLELLDARNTKLTDEGGRRLTQALPKCRLFR
jgi:Leucine-rich repeat (LRR) protein